MSLTREEAKDRLIFALDVPDRHQAVEYVKQLDGTVGCFKVGLELFVREGPQVLKAVSDHTSAGIFLDLKLHDIPATVRGAVRAAAHHKVRFLTVHASGGKAMLQSAAGAGSGVLEVLAVTALTSMNRDELTELGFRDDGSLSRLVADMAAWSKEAGCAGVVCSGDEIETVRLSCGDGFKVVVPGIRPKWAAVEGDDQSRVTTPAEAIRRGADHIVVGRPIRDAKDPREAAEKILEEIQSASG